MSSHLYNLQAYQYSLPPELIAQHPCAPRENSRVLVLDRKKQTLSEMKFYELKDFLVEGDSLIFNDTKVIPARLIGKRSSGGGKTEIFLLKRLSLDTWKVLARPGKKLRPGIEVIFADHFKCQVLEEIEDGAKIVQFTWEGVFEERLNEYGQLPLPHYIQRTEQSSQDAENYQTVYASQLGAMAAPAAGLHFSQTMLEELKQKGIQQHHLTLHTGLGTFRPVQVSDIRLHKMHEEPFLISPETAQKLNAKDRLGKRQISVGTTCCRALESACNEQGQIVPGCYETNIFIYPGYSFKYVQSLLTNFHAPGSTLLMLICAFAGYEFVMEAYAKAVKERFRFLSYGDAMLII